jgi:small subunit ribosomal protein S6
MKYELMVILKPLLPEDIRAGIQKRLESLLKKFKGEIKAQDNWGKKHLAYPIKKNDEGYYIVYQLEMDPSTIDSFKQELKLISDILRFLLTKTD